MNIILLHALRIGLVALSVSSFSVSAQTLLTITGKIEEATCTPTLTGTNVTANSIGLDPAQLSDLDVAAKTAKPRTITFALSNCGMSTAINNMWVHFTAASVTGGRINTNNANVAFQIMDVPSGGGTGNQVNVGGTAGTTGPGANQGTGAALTGTQGSRSVSKSYIVRYYAKASVTLAGDVTAQATYTVKYY